MIRWRIIKFSGDEKYYQECLDIQYKLENNKELIQWYLILLEDGFGGKYD